MCELLAMSANTPTDLCFSFTGLTRRGGETGPHKDGWGVSFYEGKGVRSFHDSDASASSAWPKWSRPTRSKAKWPSATSARPTSAKSAWPTPTRLSANSGAATGSSPITASCPTSGPQRGSEPVGDTDSEALFCDILNHLRSHCDRNTTLEEVVERLVRLSQAYAREGVFNLLLSNGDWLFTYCTTKMASITRRAPFGPARLKDADVTVDFESETTPNDVVSVIVTEPLTSDEQWDIYQPGEWRLWKKGEVIASSVTPEPPESR